MWSMGFNVDHSKLLKHFILIQEQPLSNPSSARSVTLTEKDKTLLLLFYVIIGVGMG